MNTTRTSSVLALATGMLLLGCLSTIREREPLGLGVTVGGRGPQ